MQKNCFGSQTKNLKPKRAIYFCLTHKKVLVFFLLRSKSKFVEAKKKLCQKKQKLGWFFLLEHLNWKWIDG